MKNIVFKQVKEKPSAISQYLKILFGSKPKGSEIPNIGIEADLGEIKKEDAVKFLKVSEFDTNTNQIPLAFFHLLGHPYAVELMTSKEFPFKLLGSIHITSTISKYANVDFGESLKLKLYFGDKKPHAKGLIIPLIQEVYKGGELVWKEEMEFLRPMPTKNTTESKKEVKSSDPISGVTEDWSLSSDLGIRYGKVSGDLNPIHLRPLTAKLFGFKSHIAHGYWSLSRALASLEPKIKSEKYTLTCALKLPLYLPNKVKFNYAIQDSGDILLEVRDKNNVKPHLVADIKIN